MTNTIKPEDKLSEEHLNRLDLRYEDILLIYAVLGKTNGYPDLWEGAKAILSKITSPVHVNEVYNEFIRNKDTPKVIQYATYNGEWSRALLPQESPQQQKLRELEDTIKSAQKQIEEIKGGIL